MVQEVLARFDGELQPDMLASTYRLCAWYADNKGSLPASAAADFLAILNDITESIPMA